MSTVLQVTLSPEAQALLRAAPNWPAALDEAVRRVIDTQNELTVGAIQEHKLSVRGPDTLGVVTNRLRLSARPAKARVSAGGIRSGIGSNVKYAGVHEFGFTGTVQVKAFMRHQVSNDIVGGKRRGFSARRKREKISAMGIARVRAHVRKMAMPARAPFRTGIEERLPAYSAAISAAVIKVLSPS